MNVSDILSTHQGSKYSEDDVRRVVASCSKNRFALQEDPSTGMLQIRANQGHTIQVLTNKIVNGNGISNYMVDVFHHAG